MARRPPHLARLTALIAPVFIGVGSFANEPETPELPEAYKPKIEITVTPGVWLPRPTGNVQLGPSPTARELDFQGQLDLRGQEPTFTGDILVEIDDRWRLHVDGFDFSGSGETLFFGQSSWGSLNLFTGDPIATSLDITSLEFDAGYAVLRADDGDADNFIELSPVVGLRWLEVTQSITQIGVGREDATGTWVGILLGIQLDFAFTPKAGTRWPFHRLEAYAHAAFGPAMNSRSGTMTQVRAGISFWANDHVGFLFGFRMVDLNAEDGAFELDGGLQGVFLAATLRF